MGLGFTVRVIVRVRVYGVGLGLELRQRNAPIQNALVYISLCGARKKSDNRALGHNSIVCSLTFVRMSTIYRVLCVRLCIIYLFVSLFERRFIFLSLFLPFAITSRITASHQSIEARGSDWTKTASSSLPAFPPYTHTRTAPRGKSYTHGKAHAHTRPC